MWAEDPIGRLEILGQRKAMPMWSDDLVWVQGRGRLWVYIKVQKDKMMGAGAETGIRGASKEVEKVR